MKKLTQAREQRGWSLYRLAEETGVSRAALRNLERCLEEGRAGLPANVTALTMVRLLETLPELELSDFVPGTTLRLRQRKGAA